MQSPQKLKVLSILFLLFSLGGFIDASYLTAKHYLGTPIPCSIFGGCDIVTTSIYSHIGPVPIALIGALYYLLLIILTILYFDSKKTGSLKISAYLTIGGIAASLVLVYLQIFVIHEICLYCMISATISLVLFGLGQLILRTIRKNVIVTPSF